MKGAIFLIIALAVSLGAVGATTALISSAAPVYAGGECHSNQGSIGCTGSGGGGICNKQGCHPTGPH